MKKKWETPVVTVLVKGKIQGGFLSCFTTQSTAMIDDPYCSAKYGEEGGGVCP